MNILVISPHPDDEVIGCGGFLLKKNNKDNKLFWAIITTCDKDNPDNKKFISKRRSEIIKVSQKLKFTERFELDFKTTMLDSVDKTQIIEKLTAVIQKCDPNILLIPYIHDAHSDHRVTAECMMPFIKSFRFPNVRKVLMYETLSETNFQFVSQAQFCPNYFIDISDYIDTKIEIAKLYASEIGRHPFPRSSKSIKALAWLRGSQSGNQAAEAFQLIFAKE